MLEAFLDWYRAELVRKVAGVTEEQAWARLVPSATSLAGLVKHMRWVEINWFGRVLAGRPAEDFPPVPWSKDNPDGDMLPGPGETLESVIADYWSQVASSREVAAGLSLDDTGAHRVLGDVSLRWVYVHLIEEIARHTGHADILREQTDGFVGDEPNAQPVAGG